MMQKIKLDPIPDMYSYESALSETGTDFSQAHTSEPSLSDLYRRMDSPEILTPPESPPWRHHNEGGVIAEMPLQPLDEVVLSRGIVDSALPYSGQTVDTFKSMAMESPMKTQVSDHKAPPAHNVKAPSPHLPRPSPQQPKRTSSYTAQVDNNPLATGKQITLGITFGRDEDESMLPGLKVVRLKDGGVAALSGRISVGDRVITVDGNDISKLSPVEANRLLVGAEGSVAVLRVMRHDNQDSLEEIAIQRIIQGQTPQRNAFGVVRKL
mmetsp:Transcript_43448/g.137379  ORF Transcript_43448/g.137379 Transcript_43448/m.137379 type:complete len:267 (+) Transcript_43448:543-1343(+)